MTPTFMDDLEELKTSVDEVTQRWQKKQENEKWSLKMHLNCYNFTEEKNLNDQKSGFLKWNLFLVKML